VWVAVLGSTAEISLETQCQLHLEYSHRAGQDRLLFFFQKFLFGNKSSRKEFWIQVKKYSLGIKDGRGKKPDCGKSDFNINKFILIKSQTMVLR
jgi:hypothetical protein